MFDSVPFWMWPVGFLLILGPLVTIHELGHYLVARWFGVKADAFSVGFGKEIAGRTDKHGTRWKISALPLGGYVQFRGDMNPASIPDPQALKDIPEDEREEGNFHHAVLWKRALIVFAGPATNLLVAITIFAGFVMIYGKPMPVDPAQTNVVASFSDQSTGRDAGLEVGDRILAIDGRQVDSFAEIVQNIMLYPGKEISIKVDRKGDQTEFPVTIGDYTETDRFGNESRIGRIGVYSAQQQYVRVGMLEAIAVGAGQTVRLTDMMVTGVAQIFSGDRSLRELGGPIKIAKFSGEQLSLGPEAFVWFMAAISLNLAFINLLPIPALDGGHLAFYAVEAVRRKPVGPRGTEWAYRTGIALVLMLMVFVTVNDVVSLPIFGG